MEDEPKVRKLLYNPDDDKNVDLYHVAINKDPKTNRFYGTWGESPKGETININTGQKKNLKQHPQLHEEVPEDVWEQILSGVRSSEGLLEDMKHAYVNLNPKQKTSAFILKGSREPGWLRIPNTAKYTKENGHVPLYKIDLHHNPETGEIRGTWGKHEHNAESSPPLTDAKSSHSFHTHPKVGEEVPEEIIDRIKHNSHISSHTLRHSKSAYVNIDKPKHETVGYLHSLSPANWRKVYRSSLESDTGDLHIIDQLRKRHNYDINTGDENGPDAEEKSAISHMLDFITSNYNKQQSEINQKTNALHKAERQLAKLSSHYDNTGEYDNSSVTSAVKNYREAKKAYEDTLEKAHGQYIFYILSKLGIRPGANEKPNKINKENKEEFDDKQGAASMAVKNIEFPDSPYPKVRLTFKDKSGKITSFSSSDPHLVRIFHDSMEQVKHRHEHLREHSEGIVSNNFLKKYLETSKDKYFRGPEIPEEKDLEHTNLFYNPNFTKDDLGKVLYTKHPEKHFDMSPLIRKFEIPPNLGGRTLRRLTVNHFAAIHGVKEGMRLFRDALENAKDNIEDTTEHLSDRVVHHAVPIVKQSVAHSIRHTNTGSTDKYLSPTIIHNALAQGYIMARDAYMKARKKDPKKHLRDALILQRFKHEY
jgi:hypothetical protein